MLNPAPQVEFISMHPFLFLYNFNGDMKKRPKKVSLRCYIIHHHRPHFICFYELLINSPYCRNLANIPRFYMAYSWNNTQTYLYCLANYSIGKHKLIIFTDARVSPTFKYMIRLWNKVIGCVVNFLLLLIEMLLADIMQTPSVDIQISFTDRDKD